jgi:DNA-binding NarL/FixJ family response regulator
VTDQIADPDPIRVALVDDHPMVLDGLRLALDTPGTLVVGSAATAAEAVRMVAEARPRVVVLDVHLPDASGINAAAALREQNPDIAILILTMSEDPHTLAAAMRAGAAGYLVKGASRDEIVRAVRAVADGQIIFSAEVARTALSGFSPRPDADSAEPFARLTARERQVLALLGAGLGNPEIARRLGISAKTAANHVSAVLVKLGMADRTQAALLARDLGLRPAQPHRP